MMQSALSGVTVIECAEGMAGPLAGAMLGDLGADVIKIERPTASDRTRRAPEFAGVPQGLADGGNAIFETFNRNKRSLALEIHGDAGAAVLRDLLAAADILVIDWLPAEIEQRGLRYEALKQLHPRLLYGTVTGYGSQGPDADRPALEPLTQARSGLMWGVGGPGDPPNWISLGLAEIMAGSMLAYGLVTAVVARDRTGLGQKVETSHLLGSISLESWSAGIGMLKGVREWPRAGRRTAGNPLFNHYRCADDQWLTLGMVESERDWASFCQILGLADLAEVPRFHTWEMRKTNAPELIALLDAQFATQPRAVWEQRLRSDSHFIFDRIQKIGDLPTDPAVRANDYLTAVDHPRYGATLMLNHPATLTKTPATIRRVAPQLGEHSLDILRERLGYDQSRLTELLNSKAVFQRG